MFEGFADRRVAVGKAELYCQSGGAGPPLLLLHGYPQTHVAWHRVAPRLMRNFTVIVPDLRGYGQSRGPGPDPEHRNYSKRAMAADMAELMTALGRCVDQVIQALARHAHAPGAHVGATERAADRPAVHPDLHVARAARPCYPRIRHGADGQRPRKLGGRPS